MITQLATVKARLEIADADPSHDELLTRAIEAVGARFDRECSRTLARTVDATQEFAAGDTEIVARCYPVETVTKFELKTSEADGWVEQGDVAWLVRGGCVISLRAPLSFVPRFAWFSPAVARVTYTGGYVLPGTVPSAGQTGLPADLESAAVEQVAAWFHKATDARPFFGWLSRAYELHDPFVLSVQSTPSACFELHCEYTGGGRRNRPPLACFGG